MIDQRTTELRRSRLSANAIPTAVVIPLTALLSQSLLHGQIRDAPQSSAELPELFQLISIHIGIAEQMVQRIVSIE